MIELLISSSLLIAIIALVRLVLKGRISLRLQYGLWVLVLLRLVMPISLFSSGMSVMNTAGALPPVEALQSVRGVAAIEYQDGSVIGYSPGDYMRDFPAVLAKDTTEAEYSRMEAALTLKRVLPYVWLGGSVLFLLALILSNALFFRKLRRTRKLLNDSPFASSLTLRTCPLPVYTAEGLPSPCLYGVFRPAIYLTPEALSDEDALRHIITHELTHLHHGDNLWCALRALCLCVYWFDPFVWLAAALSKRDAELACDDGTIAALGEEQRASYGRTLISLTCERTRASDLLCTATTMTGGKRTFKERITMIARKPKMLLTTLFAVLLISAVAVGCTFTGSVAEEAASPQVPAVTPSPSPEADATDFESQRENLPPAVVEQAEKAVAQWYESDSADFPDYKLSKWRITDMTMLYTYATDSDPLWVYSLNYEYFSEAPDKIALTGRMYVDINGWYCPVTPASSYIVYNIATEEALLTMCEDDCKPGDAVFTSDMNLLLEQRGQKIVAKPALTIDEVITTIDGINWQDYSREHSSGETVDYISRISQLVYFASYFVIDSDQMQVFLTSTDGLDGAASDAYAVLIANLYTCHRKTFVAVYQTLPEEDRRTVYNFIDYAATGIETTDLGIENVYTERLNLADAETFIRDNFNIESIRTLQELHFSVYDCNMLRSAYLEYHPDEKLEPENIVVFLGEVDFSTTNKSSPFYAPNSDGTPKRVSDFPIIAIRSSANAPWSQVTILA